MSDASERPVFILRLRPEKNIDPLRALRWVLKHMLRQHGMQCISCVEEGKDGETLA
jgi:hypothetical protein